MQNFLTAAESKAFVKTAEAIGFVHQGSLGPTKGEAYRDNDRIAVNDPVLADTLWESGLSKHFSDITIRGKAAVGLNPNIRLYRFVQTYHHGCWFSKIVVSFIIICYYVMLIMLYVDSGTRVVNVLVDILMKVLILEKENALIILC